MKKKKLLFFAVLTVLLSACSSESEEVAETNVVHEFSKLMDASEAKTQKMFGDYSASTRSMGVTDNTQKYDFSKSQMAYILSKDAYVYMIPKDGDSSGDNLLVGIGTEDDVYVQLYLEKKNENEYTLFNQDHEPIYDITYNKDSNISKAIKCYGNDVTVIPSQTRAFSKHTWNVICNTAIIAGGVSLAWVGALPTLGASIGCTVVCGVAAAAMC